MNLTIYARNDNRISSWAVYIEKSILKIDINFINHNGSVYSYHTFIDIYKLQCMKSDLKSFAIYLFTESQRTFESEQILGVIINERFDDFCLSAKKPISSCRDLYKHFIGRHRVIPVYLTPKFEIEFNHNMSKLENLEKIISEFC